MKRLFKEYVVGIAASLMLMGIYLFFGYLPEFFWALEKRVKNCWRHLEMWVHWRTLLAATWRAFVAVADWRTILRKIRRQPTVDVVFITNMRDQTDRRRGLGKLKPRCGHFSGIRYWIDDIVARMRVLDVTTDDLFGSQRGRMRAKESFINATKWASKNGARVVLLAAGTKRLFGEAGIRIRELFPDITFTIGDNGTMFLLKAETLRALKGANLRPAHCRVAVLGPYGFLGEMMVKALGEEGYEIVGAGPNMAALKRVEREYGIETCQDFSEMGRVDAVVACTHSTKIRLTAENIESIRRPDRKLLVVDVAEPANLGYREYLKCKKAVIRQDAGNAFAPELKYVLGGLAYRRLRLSQGVTFGCFAEAICIAAALNRGEDMRGIDWFSVNEVNMKTVGRMFEAEGFTMPSPRCFSREIGAFELALPVAKAKGGSCGPFVWDSRN